MSDDISDYVQNKGNFAQKNKTSKFQTAVQEADDAIKEQTAHSSMMELQTVKKITLKNVAIDELLATFYQHKTTLQTIFDQRRSKQDRFNYGNGLDFLTILSRLVTPEQQAPMYKCICRAFVTNQRKYLENPTVSIWSRG